MRLSIITINYNNLDGLRKTIDSVVSQTFRDFEWIIIDGGSTDGSKQLIEQNAEHFSYWVSEPDTGIYNAMNKGIKQAHGKYLQFLNSGDWFYDENSLMRCFQHEFNTDIVYGDLYFVKENGELELSSYPQQLTIHFLYHFSLGHNASFIKRSLMQKDPYDEHYTIVSDWKFFLKQALAGSTFERIGEVITCFDTTGISSCNEVLIQEERNRAIKELIPETLIHDFNLIDKLQTTLDKDQVKKVLKYGSKKRIYHKLITGALAFIELLDKHL